MKKISKKKLFISLAGAVAIVVIWLLTKGKGNEATSHITFGTVSRGNIETIISSTGTLKAIGTVDVGTQVSGRIDKIMVDFNDEVQKNQILAVLDTIRLSQSVAEAKATLKKQRALYEQATFQYERISKLYQQNLVSEQEFVDAKTNKSTSEVGVKQAQIALDKAVADYGYAIIRSPISGTVIDRAVEEGQTVAASFSTPTLFTIARDMTKMEIEALVDESDIGSIRTGQKVRFTVQSYQDKTFNGVVKQVRLQPTTVSNVVNYTVIVEAGNDEQLLLPGMTATVDFIIDAREEVLVVPNTALKIQPTEKMLAEAQQAHRKRLEQMPDSVKIGARARMERSRPEEMPSEPGEQKRPTVLWYVDGSDQTMMAFVKTGLSDTKNTEIITAHPEIKEGTKIIVSLTNNNAKSTSNTNRPMMGGPGGRPPF